MADYGIPIGKLFVVGLLSVILTCDIVIGLQALYYWQLNRVETSEDLYQPSPKLKALKETQQARLADYRNVNGKKGIVAIPIGRAMDLVVAELSERDGRNLPPQRESQ